jgi:hypothetical protein
MLETKFSNGVLWAVNLCGLALVLWLCRDWSRHPPAATEAVLMIGVLAVFVTIFELKNYLIKSAWMAFIFWLAIIEYRAIEKDHAESQATTAGLVKMAQDTANNTLSARNELDSLVLQVGVVSQKLDMARSQNNQKQVDVLSVQKNALLRELALRESESVVQQMHALDEQWNLEDRQLWKGGTVPEPQLGALRAVLNAKNTQSAKPLFIEANSIRETLLQDDKTKSLQDHVCAFIYEKVLSDTPIDFGEMNMAASCLQEVVRISKSSSNHTQRPPS